MGLGAAEREYMRALELNPGYATAHHRYSIYLAFRGRLMRPSPKSKQALAN